MPSVFAESASYPPRDATRVSFFVDGEESFAQIAAAIESAERYVYVTCAYTSLNFRLRPPETEQLLDLCRRVSARGVTVALLFWKPTGKVDGTVAESEQAEIARVAPAVLARWDVARVTSIYPPQLGCHHQKTFVVDGRVAFVGGINMTQDYWDTCDHKSLDDRRVSYDVTDEAQRKRLVAAALPLHDVFARFDGAPVADVEANFVERWNGATVRGARDLTSAMPVADGGGAVRMQVLRTLAPNSYPHTSAGETSIKEAMLNVIAGARRGIYLENQYFFDDDIVSALRAAGERGVRVVGLLTRRPDAGQFVGALEALLEDGSESRFQWTHFNPALKQRIQLYTPFTSDGANPKDIYVHSKTMVVDDEWVITGSANISFTSMDFHSEMSILVEDKALARGLRGRLWAEHLCCAERDVPDDFERGADLWKAHGDRNAELLRKGMQLPTRVVSLAPPTTFVPDILVTGTNSEDDVSIT